MFYFTPYVLLPLLSVQVMAGLTCFTWRNRETQAAKRLFWLMLSMLVWSVIFTLQLSSGNLAFKSAFFSLGGIMAELTVIALLFLSFELTGLGDRLTPARILPIFIFPLCTTAAVVTSGLTGLWLNDLAIIRDGNTLGLTYSAGAYYKVHYVFIAGISAVSMILLAHGLLRAEPGERPRFLLPILATLLPLVPDIAKVSPVKGVAFTVPIFWLAGTGYALAIFRYGLIGILPLAKDALFESMADPVLVLYGDNRLAGSNAAARRAFGLGERQIDTDAGAALSGYPSLAASLAGGNTDANAETATAEAAGRHWHISIMNLSKPAMGNEGRLIVFRDVTELKEAEKTQRIAREEAERMSGAKSRLLSVMSHEMRTPLHSMMGSLEMLESTSTGPGQKKYVMLFERACRTLSLLLDDAMDRSLLETGKFRIIMESVSPRDVIKELHWLLAFDFAQKGLQFGISVADDVPETITSDGRRLLQILMNLAGNALKYTDRGRVDVSMQMHPGQPGTLRICVEDTGIGIEPARFDSLFEPFSKAVEQSRQRGGLGLGLSIVRGIAKLLGGEISVESRPGVGSVFTVDLPVSADGADDEASGPQTAENGIPRGLGILVVDDVTLNKDMLKMHLEGTGATTTEAADGGVALEIFRPGLFDLVLLDMMLPVMSGVEVARKIREREASAGSARTPILGMSADARMETEREARASGCDDYLVRPVSRNSLFASIRKVLQRATPVQSSGEDPAEKIGRMVPDVILQCIEYASNLPGLADSGDWEAARRIGHSIKGLGQMFGLDGVSSLGAAIEEAAGRKDRETVKNTAANLLKLLKGGTDPVG